MFESVKHVFLVISAKKINFPSRFNLQQTRFSSNNAKSPDSKQQKVVEQNKIFDSALRKLDEMRRMYTWRGKLLFASFGFVIMAGGYAYFFKDEMRDIMAEEVSTVAKRSLENEHLLSKTEQLSKDLVHNLLHDPILRKQSSEFVLDVLSSDETKQAATNLLLGVILDKNVINEVSSRLKEILLTILKADDTRNIVEGQVEKLLHDESVKSSLQLLIKDITHTPEVQKLISEFFRDVLASEMITEQGSVISDKVVQEKAGEALWSTFKYSILPKRFYVTDVKD